MYMRYMREEGEKKGGVREGQGSPRPYNSSSTVVVRNGSVSARTEPYEIRTLDVTRGQNRAILQAGLSWTEVGRTWVELRYQKPAPMNLSTVPRAQDPLSHYGPTKVVTLEAGRVALNALPPTAILGCCTRSRLDEVTQGVTEVAAKPFN